jgi:hypothetical protein
VWQVEGGLDGSVTTVVVAVVVEVADFDLKVEDRRRPLKGLVGGRTVEDLGRKIVHPFLAAIARWAQARQRAVEHSAVRAGGCTRANHHTEEDWQCAFNLVFGI